MKTIGELRAALTDYPDEMPITVTTSGINGTSFGVDFFLSVVEPTGEHEGPEVATVVVFGYK